MLSEAARDILRRRFSGQRVEVDPDSRDAYRELAAAGLAEPVSGFISGPEANFRLTKEACDRREEFTSSAGRP
jgi:hypothetical protein